MKAAPATLFSPELDTDHPVVITPAIDIADENPWKIGEQPGTDGIASNVFRGEGTRVGISQQNATEAYDISWPKKAGAKKYRLYGSMSPTNKSNLLQDDILTNEARFFPPYFSELVSFYFWVSSVDGDGAETYFTDVPASLMSSVEKSAFARNPFPDTPLFPGGESLNKELAKAIGFIRTSHQMQAAVSAEPALLYLRRHAGDRPWGMACSCTSQNDKDDDDQEYIGVENCLLCFGTGIFGGYLPAISIDIRYGSAPEQKYIRSKGGFLIDHAFNTWMLPHPVVRTGDLLVRVTDGSRYRVGRTKPDISSRAVRLHQEFDLDQVQRGDILFSVTDVAIARSIEKAELPSFLKDGYRIFG